MAVSPLAMLRALAMAQQQGGFSLPMVQRAAAASPQMAGNAGMDVMRGGGGADRLEAPAALPPAVAVPMPRLRPATPGGGSYNAPSGNAGLGKLKDVLTAAAMGTIAAPPGAGIITSAASGFAGARAYKDQKASDAAASERQARIDASEAEYKQAQIANLQRQASETNLTPSQDDYQFYVGQEKAAGREPVSFFDFKKHVGSTDESATERIARALMDENPGLTFSDALRQAQKAPNESGETLSRERLAMDAAKADPDWGAEDNNKVLNRWRKFYGLPPKDKKKDGNGKNKPAAEAAADPAVQPPAATPQRAVNPDTGAAVIWNGTAWVPE